MKTWITYTAAIAIGLSATLLLGDLESYGALLDTIVPIVRQIGVFILFPVVFVLFTSGIASLRKQKETGVVLSSTLLWSLATTLLLSVATALITLVVPLGLSAGGLEQAAHSPTDIPRIGQLVPLFVSNNAFEHFTVTGTSLIPIIVVASLCGYALKPDRETIRPAYVVTNSFAEAMLRLSRLFTIIGAVLIMFLAADWFRFVDVPGLFHGNAAYFTGLGIILALALGILLPLLYALFSRFKGGNPYRMLFGTLPALLGSGFSGSLLYGTAPLIALSQKNNGVRKRIAGTAIPLYTVFGRGGCAMVATFTLITVIEVSQGVSLPVQTLLLIALFASLFSLASSFSAGYEVLFIAVMVMRGINPSETVGLETVVLMFLPFLQAIAMVIDTAIASLGAAFSSRIVSPDDTVAYRDMM